MRARPSGAVWRESAPLLEALPSPPHASSTFLTPSSHHSDPTTYVSVYAQASDPLILQDGRSGGRRLNLFAAAHVRGSGASTSASTSSPPPLEAGVAADLVLFAGGPVWALDWCPQVVREGDRVSRFLAVSEGREG